MEKKCISNRFIIHKTANGSAISIWDLKKRIYSLEKQVQQEFDFKIKCITTMPENDFACSDTSADGSVIRIFSKELQLKRELKEFDHKVECLTFMHNMNFIVSGSDRGENIFWSYATGALLRKVNEGNKIYCMKGLRNGDLAFKTHYERSKLTCVKICNFKNCEEI